MNEMWRWIELDSGIMGTGSPSLRLLKIKQVVSRRVVHHRRNGIAEPQHAAGNLMLFCDKTFPSSSRPVMPVIVSLQGVVSRRGNSFFVRKSIQALKARMPAKNVTAMKDAPQTDDTAMTEASRRKTE